MKQFQAIAFFLLIALIMISSQPAAANLSEDALISLKKFRSRCEVGISYRDYGNALAEANYQVKEYLSSSESDLNPELKVIISSILIDYLNAGALWEIKFSGPSIERTDDFVSPDANVWKTFMEHYPDGNSLMRTEYHQLLKRTFSQAYFPEILSYIWAYASNNIDKAGPLMTKHPDRKPKIKPKN